MNTYVEWNGSDEIDMQSYDRFILHMRRKKRRQNGIATATAVLRAYAKFLDINTDKWQRPRTQEVAVTYLRPNEIQLMRNACRQGNKIELELFCFDFLLGTGMRVTELVKLRWTDIDLVERTIIVREAKENKSRIFKLTATAWQAASRWGRHVFGPRIRPEALKLKAEKVIPLTTKESIEVMLKRIAARAHLDVLGIHPHMLRHSFGAITIKNKMLDMRELQMHLGHSSLNTTMRYAQFGLLEGEKGLEKVDISK